MANRDLLKEAIADAKSVKEAAIANAKAALEEAFTPYLKEKFSAKLAEMEAEEEVKENYSEEKMEEKMSNPDQRRGDDEKKNGKFSRESEPEIETEKMAKKLKEEDTLDEMDLDELLAELDEEMGKEKDMEENLNEDARTDAEEEGYLDGMKDEKEDEEDDEIDLEDMTEEELKDLIEDVIEDMVRAGELEAGEEFESDEDEDEEEDIDIDIEDEEETIDENARTDAEEEGYLDGMHDEKYDLTKEEKMDEGIKDKLKKFIDTLTDPEKAVIGDDLFKFVDKMDKLPAGTVTKGMEKSGAGKTSRFGENARTDAEEEGYLDGMRDEKEDLKEMKSEIAELAATLAETKLLNAKLLYSNKIFRAKNLTETQKVKVLEAFDKAHSVSDAKLIYETLTAIKDTKSSVNESVRGMASKAAGMAPEKKPILEVNDQFARWKVLAGIKNN